MNTLGAIETKQPGEIEKTANELADTIKGLEAIVQSLFVSFEPLLTDSSPTACTPEEKSKQGSPPSRLLNCLQNANGTIIEVIRSISDLKARSQL